MLTHAESRLSAAIDAPSPSLPLVNSLTHLSYLTATSPRIREILSLDGGLERLVRILKSCAAGGPKLVEANLSELKGKRDLEKTVGGRRSPFKPFSEYGKKQGSKATASGVAPAPVGESRTKRLLYTYTLAFQCVVNIGVRGSELIRTRVVEAGALDVVVNVLERYLEEVEKRRRTAQSIESVSALSSSSITPTTTLTKPALDQLDNNSSDSLLLPPPTRVATPDTIVSMDDGSQDNDGDGSATEPDEAGSASGSTTMSSRRRAGKEVDQDGDVCMDSNDAQREQQAQPSQPKQDDDQGLQYRDEDVLLSLQLLAYLSKYPHVRSVFHSAKSDDPEDQDIVSSDSSLDLKKPVAVRTSTTTAITAWTGPPSYSASTSSINITPPTPSPSKAPPHLHSHSTTPPPPPPTFSSNVFSLVESFTYRPPNSDALTPRHSTEVQYWAGVIMRNACRKDESQGGIRQCANMQCGVWEKSPREFAKCRRCRKAKYCSKSCQSKAWQFGHRYWCSKAAPKDTCDEPTSTSALVPTISDTTSRRSRHHHSHPHPSVSRSSTSASLDEDDDNDDPPPPPLPAHPSSATGLPAYHHHHHHRFSQHDGVGVGGDPSTMDENEVAQEMIGGGVFGEMTRGNRPEV